MGSDDGPTPTIGAMSETYYDSDRSDEFGFGGPRSTAGIQGICIHTTESGKSATATSSTADAVTSYQVRTRTGSYHVMVGVDGKRIRQNTDDWATWSTGNQGNNILLHLCVVGNAEQTRWEWLAQDTMLRAAASVVRYWSDRYDIPLRKVSVAELPGICGHDDTRVWGGTDHTDPGPGFPYDKLVDYAKGPTTAAQPDLVQQIVDQLRNPAGIGWPQFVGNTIGDALAALQTTLTTRLKTLVR